MDPNEALKRIREALAAFNADEDGDWDPLDLVEPLESLMSWLDNGGFLPGEWTRAFCPVVEQVVRLDAERRCPVCSQRHPIG